MLGIVTKLKNGLRISRFSRAQLIIFVIAFGLIGYLVYNTFAQSSVIASVEAEQMTLPAAATVYSDSTASGSQAVKFISNGVATTSFSLSSATSSLTVSAKSQQCSGSPSVSVAIDGTTVMPAVSVPAAAWATYNANATLGAGTHKLTVTASNVIKKGGGKKQTCSSRPLFVDVTQFISPAPTAPTVSISASPSIISSGQSSSLSWASTNASSCNATGDWSGAKPTSGSSHTGALNQSASYAITCTGGGGTTSASTTVTVNPVTPPSAPTVYINPLGQAYNLGSTFTVEVRENSGNKGVNAVQANFSYPTDKLTLISIDTAASAFTTEAQTSYSSGQVQLGRGIIGSVSGDQLVARVTFSVNSVGGTASIPFVSGTALLDSTTNADLLTSLAQTGTANFTLQ